MTLFNPDLFKQLRNHTIFLDTNVFSTASKSPDFADFLITLKSETSCAYATIPSVVFETTQGSSSLEFYNKRADYVHATVSTVVPTTFIDKIPDFCVLMAKLNGNNKSFTDFLLAACLYYYRHSPVYLMTTDLKAFPTFFDRDHIITTEEKSGNLNNFGLFKLNESAYVKALSHLIN